MTPSPNKYAKRPARLDVDEPAGLREDSVPCSTPECANRVLKIDIAKQPTKTPYCIDCRCAFIDDNGIHCNQPHIEESVFCDLHTNEKNADIDIGLSSFVSDTIESLVTNDMSTSKQIDETAASSLAEEIATSEADRLPARIFEIMELIENRSENISTRASSEAKELTGFLKMDCAKLYNVKFDIGAQVTIALHLLDLATRDPDIIKSVKSKIGNSRNPETFHRLLWLSICEKWYGKR